MTTPTTSLAPAAPRRPGSTVTVIGIVLLVIGLLSALAGGAVLLSGAVADGVRRAQGDDGFLTSGPISLTTDSYAITSPAQDAIEVESDLPEVPFELATLRLTVAADEGPVFVGVAAQDDVDRYLSDVEHSEVRRIGFPSDVQYRDLPGSAPSVPPDDLDIWVVSASGSGPQDVEWSLTPGEWGIVVMNADADRGVDVEMDVGVRSDLIAPTATALLVLGGLLFAVGASAVVIGNVLLGLGQRGLRSPAEDAREQRPPRPYDAPS